MILNRYHAETKMYTDTVISKVMLDNSTQVQVNVPLQFAKFDNGIWIDIRTIEELNNIIVPEQVTAIQFIAQLSFEGINEQMILQVIEALPEPTKTIASASFKRAVFFERNSPFIPLIAQVFSKTKEQIDDIFIKANQL